MLTVLIVNTHLFVYVYMYMKITKLAFQNQHPNGAMILPCLQSLQGKEGVETSWSMLDVKLLGTEFVQNKLASPPWALAVDTFMVCGQLAPASPAESSKRVALGRELGKIEGFSKTESN